MKNEDKNQVLYEKAKREWEQSPNDVDSGKTNKEYFDEWKEKFNDEVFVRANEQFSEKARKERETFFTCSRCKEKVSLANEMEHELHHTLYPSWEHKTHDEKIQTSVQKIFMIIVVAIGLAFIALWVYMSVVLPFWCAYTKCVDVGKIDLPLPAAGPNFRP